MVDQVVSELFSTAEFRQQIRFGSNLPLPVTRINVSVSALAICTKPAPQVGGSVVIFWQDKLHVAHGSHNTSAQVSTKSLRAIEST
jgi:hypothetical protein